MDYAEMVDALAPCGLNCQRCAEYQNGEIQKSSKNLIRLLGNYQRVAKIKEESIPAFRAYQEFLDVLTIFAEGSCGGCRSQTNRCFLLECAAKTCYREKGVDFCFQCPEFPCKKPNPTGERWIQMNQRMLEIGVEQFFEEQSKLPRYGGKGKEEQIDG